MPEDIPIKPLRYLMSNLCEKHEIVNVIDALILALEEQQKRLISKEIQVTELDAVLCSLENARQQAIDIPWH